VPSRLRLTTVSRDLPATLRAFGESIAPGISERVAVVEAAIGSETVSQYLPGGPSQIEFRKLAAFVRRELKKCQSAG